MQNCPKCGNKHSVGEEQCLKCGVIFRKIRDTSHEMVEYSPSQVVPAAGQKNAGKILIAAILTAAVMLTLFRLHTEPQVPKKPRSTISEDGTTRMTRITDSSGREQIVVERLDKPTNEEERQAIEKRKEQEQRYSAERALTVERERHEAQQKAEQTRNAGRESR